MKEKVARRIWGVMAWNAGINPTIDGRPITYDNGPIWLRSFCRSVADIAIEEIDTITSQSNGTPNGVR
jgi:hypothetical protein